jgi:hypothetical protein
MQTSSKLLMVLMAILLLAVAVARPHPTRVPVRPGTAEGYWDAAAGVRENVIPSGSWFLTEPVNGFFLYSRNHMHGSYFYQVPVADVFATFPISVDQLGGEGKRVLPWAEPGFRTWQEADPQRSNPQLLLLYLREAQLEWWASKSVESRLLLTTADFELGIAYQRLRLFPLVEFLEWAYLSALVVFAAWPWLKKRPLSQWVVHAALLPLLLLLPYYLGYCAWNFTSAGPGGGVVYPFILDAFPSLPWTPLDQFLVGHVPQPLAPLTGPLGPMMSLSGGRHAGPSSAVGMGLALGAVVLSLGWLLRSRPRT